ncbi:MULTISPECIES: hypothetical protein [unclassified Nocardiopsis]|uniref:hypothetical protein n=1 Tax=unclassified Nocardiopsis TaxID=2649073 RepID=UPI000490BDAD|nr:hypothetical protein [Nocardiopsis sp. CNT312]
MDDLTDEELYDELIASLAAEGVRATPGLDRASILIHNDWALGDEAPERFDPPLELAVSPQMLGRHLRAIAPEAQDALGQALSPLGAAMSLFLVHIMAAVETKPGRHFTIDPPN